MCWALNQDNQRGYVCRQPYLLVLADRQDKLLLLRRTRRHCHAIDVSISREVPLVCDGQRVRMLGRDAARCYAQDSAVLSSPRCFSAQISRNAIGRNLPICGLSEVKQVINSGHRRATVNLMHQLYLCLRFVFVSLCTSKC